MYGHQVAIFFLLPAAQLHMLSDIAFAYFPDECPMATWSFCLEIVACLRVCKNIFHLSFQYIQWLAQGRRISSCLGLRVFTFQSRDNNME